MSVNRILPQTAALGSIAALFILLWVKGCSIYFEDRTGILKIETAAKLPMWLSLLKKLKISHIMSARRNNSGELVLSFSLDFKIVNNFRKNISRNTRYKFNLSNQLYVHSASCTVSAILKRATYFICTSATALNSNILQLIVCDCDAVCSNTK